MSSRTNAGLAAAAGALALAVSGCSTSSGAPSEAAGTPVSGGELHYAVAAYPQCLDAALRARLFAGPQQYVETLTDQDPETGDITPRLATSWSVENGGRTYTFALRDDVTFSDGTALTADVVKSNFDSLIALGMEGRTDTLVRSALAAYVGAEAIDEHTVRIDFSQPELGFLRNASDSYLGIYSQATTARSYDERCNGALDGSGPFVVTEAVRNERITLTRRDDYAWAPETADHDGPAHLDRIVFEVVPESGVRIGGLLSGQFDAIDEVPANDQASLGAAGAEVIFGTIPNLVPGIYHNAYSPIGGDAAVRRAILAGIDREEIRDTLYTDDYSVPAVLVASVTPLFADLSGELAYDPVRAERILTDAGWLEGPDGVRVKDGVRLEPRLIYVSGSTRGATQQDLELIQQQLLRIGIAIRLSPITAAEESAYLADVSKAPFDFASGAGAGTNIDFLVGLFRSTNPVWAASPTPPSNPPSTESTSRRPRTNAPPVPRNSSDTSSPTPSGFRSAKQRACSPPRTPSTDSGWIPQPRQYFTTPGSRTDP